jgi:hypothetical protein
MPFHHTYAGLKIYGLRRLWKSLFRLPQKQNEPKHPLPTVRYAIREKKRYAQNQAQKKEGTEYGGGEKERKSNIKPNQIAKVAAK